MTTSGKPILNPRQVETLRAAAFEMIRNAPIAATRGMTTSVFF